MREEGEASAIPRPTIPDLGGWRGEPALIVVAEDDLPTQVLLANFLKSRGYEVGVAADGLQALQLVRERLPDLVLVDVNMPAMNGLELVRRLRSHHKTAAIPVLMLSAESETPQVLAGYNEGADDYVAKPVSLAVLGARIEVLLAHTKASVAGVETGSVILFLHARGGVGATTVSANLACLLQPLTVTGVSVLDLNSGFGDMAWHLGARPRLGLADLSLQPPEVMNDRVFSKFLAEGPPGVHLIVAAQRPEHTELITVPAVQSALSQLRSRFQYVVVDSPVIYDEHTLAVLDAADLVCLVTTPGASSLRSTVVLLRLLERLGIPAEREFIILNSIVEEHPAVNADEQIGRPANLRIPYSGRVGQAAEVGVPLAISDPAAPELATLREFAAGLTARVAQMTPRHPAADVGLAPS